MFASGDGAGADERPVVVRSALVVLLRGRARRSSLKTYGRNHFDDAEEEEECTRELFSQPS